MYDKSIAFAGYTTERLFQRKYDQFKEGDIRLVLFKTIKGLYEAGYRTFISDMSAGFGLIAADTVIMLHDAGDCPDIRLVAVISGKKQAENYDNLSRELYNDLLVRASKKEVLSATGYNKRMQESAHIICYYDEPSKDIEHLREMGIPFTNIRKLISLT